MRSRCIRSCRDSRCRAARKGPGGFRRSRSSPSARPRTSPPEAPAPEFPSGPPRRRRPIPPSAGPWPAPRGSGLRRFSGGAQRFGYFRLVDELAVGSEIAVVIMILSTFPSIVFPARPSPPGRCIADSFRPSMLTVGPWSHFSKQKEALSSTWSPRFFCWTCSSRSRRTDCEPFTKQLVPAHTLTFSLLGRRAVAEQRPSHP